ncbi:hypothetical protein HYS28_00505, partial [Candidatus Uhrbacteria bacterium]|nr:hypothetical protein [Candidatus Uhrbacteria bacterium]
TVSVRLGYLPWWDGPLSLLIGTVLLLLIGVFVSNFIGNEIIISGLKHEKKLVERTESEVRDEAHAIDDVRREVEEIRARLGKLECGPMPEGKGRKSSGRA